MAQSGGQSNILRLSTGFLNSTNDEFPGGGVTPGDAVGQLGKWTTMSRADAQKRTDTAVTGYSSTVKLEGGRYQYVKFKAGTTQSNAFGQLVFWDDITLYQVTPDPPAGSALANVAGVTLNVVTKGNHGFICTLGIAYVLYGTITKVGGAAVGDLVIAASATVGKGNVLADATALTSLEVGRALGTAQEAATNDQTKRVFLKFLTQVF